MNNSKIARLATATFELSKMVLIITANTACKLVSVGKSEIVKQYEEYQRKATPQQRAAIGAVKELTSKGTQLAKEEMEKLEQAKKIAQQKIEEQTEKGKKLTSKATQLAKEELEKLEQAKKKAQEKIDEQIEKGKKK